MLTRWLFTGHTFWPLIRASSRFETFRKVASLCSLSEVSLFGAPTMGKACQAQKSTSDQMVHGRLKKGSRIWSRGKATMTRFMNSLHVVIIDVLISRTQSILVGLPSCCIRCNSVVQVQYRVHVAFQLFLAYASTRLICCPY